ncbi:MAG TPA: alpha-amylase family glycosyl hydrolase [Gammaproteobacteria bacterium]|nr:alpha-amylase family glycosyl hydrolase [Gammaproteobacteria bacterium]
MKDELSWWQRGVVYEVYVRSFQDSNDDGIGDLEGVLRRADYLERLGVDAIWLSPFYPSPMKDFGYDVADYTGVDPAYGAIDDFDRLAAALHERGMKVILDLVPNHTSDRHPWFLESATSRESPKRDWYLWASPGAEGGPPNNWRSEFGGSAWAWHEPTGQYYYHAFLDAQPDLNWRNPAVRAAIADVMRFWLDRGVDGFRVDVLWHLLKDELLRDNPPNPAYDPAVDSPYDALVPAYSADQPEVQEALGFLRGVVDEYDDRVLIGEVYLPIERLMAYYGIGQAGAHLPFNFHLLDAPWDAASLRAIIDMYDGSLPKDAWPNWVLGNHDRPRIASRVGPPQARVAAMLLLTLRGTPTMYYGDEIGMRNVEVPASRVRDPRELNVPGKGLGRDPYRSPMQWSADLHAGFSGVEAWLPIAPDFEIVNVAVQEASATSVLALYRALLALRRASSALTAGNYLPVEAPPPVLSYVRASENARLLVALNLSDAPCRFDPPPDWHGGSVLLSTTTVETESRAAFAEMPLGPDEGVVIAPPEAGPTSATDRAR